MLEENIQNIVM